MDSEARIKGTHLRGKNFSVSQDGRCPRCGASNVLYVILDELYPMGDMPEILHDLIAKGKAVLWSSQEKGACEAPPTFLCCGFCPFDPLGAGFNLNWKNRTLREIFTALEAPVAAAKKRNSTGISDEESSGSNTSQVWHVVDEFKTPADVERDSSSVQSSSEKEVENEDSDEEEEEDYEDEQELIKQMLAKEQKKIEEEERAIKAAKETGLAKQTPSSEIPVQTSTSELTNASQSATLTFAKSASSSSSYTYPISKNGSCPYCYSTNVKYIIIINPGTQDVGLPPTLQQLLRKDFAFKMEKGASEPPSFQCQSCQYGFNLDWSCTNLERIFHLSPPESEKAGSAAGVASSATTAAHTTAYSSHTYQGTYSSPYPTYPGTRPSPVLPSTYPPPAAPHYPPPVTPAYPPPPIPGYAPVPPPGYGSPASAVYPAPPAAAPGYGVPVASSYPPASAPHYPPPAPGYPPPGFPPQPYAQYHQSYPSSHYGSYYPPAAYSAQAGTAAQPHYRPPPVWGSPYYPPPQTRPPLHPPGHFPPQVRHIPPPQQSSPGGPGAWNQGGATASTEQQPDPAEGSTGEEDEVKKKRAALRFEMVLNQIDVAKKRVKQKEGMKHLQTGAALPPAQQQAAKDEEPGGEEPNALMDDNDDVTKFEERPPGDDGASEFSGAAVQEPYSVESQLAERREEKNPANDEKNEEGDAANEGPHAPVDDTPAKKPADALAANVDGSGVTTMASASNTEDADDKAASQIQHSRKRKRGGKRTAARAKKPRNEPSSLGTNPEDDRSAEEAGTDEPAVPSQTAAERHAHSPEDQASQADEGQEENRGVAKPRRGRKAATTPREDDGKAEPRSRGRRGRQAKVQPFVSPTNKTPPEEESQVEGEGETKEEEPKTSTRVTRGRQPKQRTADVEQPSPAEEKDDDVPRPRATRGKKTAVQRSAAAGGLSHDESANNVESRQGSLSPRTNEAAVSTETPVQGSIRARSTRSASADQGLNESSSEEATPGSRTTRWRDLSGMSADDEMSLDESASFESHTKSTTRPARKSRAQPNKRSKAAAKVGQNTAQKAEYTGDDEKEPGESNTGGTGRAKAVTQVGARRGRKRGAGEATMENISLDCSSLEIEQEIGGESEANDRPQKSGQAWNSVEEETVSAIDATAVDAQEENVEKAPYRARSTRRGRTVAGDEASVDSSAGEVGGGNMEATLPSARTRRSSRGRAAISPKPKPSPRTDENEEEPLAEVDETHEVVLKKQRTQKPQGKQDDSIDEAVLESEDSETHCAGTTQELGNADGKKAPTQRATRRRQGKQENPTDEAAWRAEGSGTHDAASAPETEAVEEKTAPSKRQARKRHGDQQDEESVNDTSREEPPAVSTTRKRGRKSRKCDPAAEEQLSLGGSPGDEEDEKAAPDRTARRLSGQSNTNEPTKRSLRKR